LLVWSNPIFFVWCNPILLTALWGPI
jgi:hypothetical protein